MDDHARLYDFLKGHPSSSPAPDPAVTKAQQSNAALTPGPGFERIGRYTFRRVLREPSPLGPLATEEPLVSAGVAARDLVFFDTETTGLSGGAGNLAFLLGAGYLDGESLVIEQYFLADFPGESEFLSLIRPLFAIERTFISYNGSAFDSHLLVSRFRMNRMDVFFPRQYDLLHPARRLWKTSIGSCTLKNIEQRVLGVERGEDIDGAAVPEYYFRYLRTGDPAPLESVLYHNKVDVLSLALLLHKIESLFREPDSLFSAANETPFAPPDPGALGSLLLARQPARAETFLEAAFDRGDARCGLLLGYYRKRRRAYDAALRVWETLFAAGAGWQAGVELAMHLEHRAHDAARALEVVRRLLDSPVRPSGALLRSLEARRKRLERKLGKNPEETAPPR